jgi:uncharacterized protein YndB with AHSA1/START domain
VTTTDRVTVSVDVAVDPATAFDVFTAQIDDWYVRGPYSWIDPTRAVALRLEPRVGGRLLEVHDLATGEGPLFGIVREWDPPHRLVWDDLTPESPADPPTQVEVRFESSGNGTRVTLEHRGLDRLPPDVAARKHVHGWITVLSWYANHMESR